MATYLKDTINYIGSIKLQKLRNPAIGLRKIRIAIDKNKHDTKTAKENLKKINKNSELLNPYILKDSKIGTIKSLREDLEELSQSLELLQAKEQDLLNSLRGDSLEKNNKKRIISKKKMIKAIKYRKANNNK